MPVPFVPVPLDSAPNVHLPPATQEHVSPEQAQSPEHVAVAAPVLEPHAASNPADEPAIPNDRMIPRRRMLNFSLPL